MVFVLCSCRATQEPEKNAGGLLLSAAGESSIFLNAASNEWVDFIIDVATPSDNKDVRLRFVGLNAIGPDVRGYLLDNRSEKLLPLRFDPSSASLLDLPSRGRLWIDLHVPTGAPAQDFIASCHLLDGNHRLAEMPLHLHVYQFSIPDQSSLTIAGEVTAAGLRQLYHGNLPDTLNPLISQCAQNRAELWFSDLRPIAHWPENTGVLRMRSADLNPGGRIDPVGWKAFLNGTHVLICQGAVDENHGRGQWFYAGDDGPMESVTLKQLRDQEQDYEYLTMAGSGPDVAMVRELASLLVEPLSMPADKTDQSLAGPLNAEAFAEGKQFVAHTVEAGSASRGQAERWKLDLVRWIAEHRHPRMLPAACKWSWNPQKPGEINRQLTLDIYNPSNISPAGNTLAWSALPIGWQTARSTALANLPSHHITRHKMQSTFDATQIRFQPNGPESLTFTSGYDGSRTDLALRFPIASCDRIERGPKIDGSLDDWSMDDAINDGALIPVFGSTEVSPNVLILANFSDSHLYLAWRANAGETGCRLVIQPLFKTNALGKLLRIECDANGNWNSEKNSALTYATTVANHTWRAEMAIPWSVLIGDQQLIPSSLRFNFVLNENHRPIASWAGPIVPTDLDQATGLLVLRNAPGQLVK